MNDMARRSSRRDPRIEEITGQPGEWFVYLRPGFALHDPNTPKAQHCFGEDTKRDIRHTMTRVTPCLCHACMRGAGNA